MKPLLIPFLYKLIEAQPEFVVSSVSLQLFRDNSHFLEILSTCKDNQNGNEVRNMYATIPSNSNSSSNKVLTRGDTNKDLGMRLQQGEEEESSQPHPTDTGTFPRLKHRGKS
jgi:hypothetical protein